ncbi:MAG: prolipoprotein diacylglyceryl transferase [Planctomycetota bacterium]
MIPGIDPTLAEAWLHGWSEVVFRIPVLGFPIRWYGLSYLAGFLVAWLVLKRLARRGLIMIPESRVSDAIVLLVAGVIVGGRLGYCVFYQPSLLISFDAGFPFWGLLRTTEGGMASHGGMIGVVLACWWISRGFKDESGVRVGSCPVLHVADSIALVAPFGLFFGRVANFVNGELLGRIVTPAASGEAAPWWSVRYPQEVVNRTEEWLANTTPAQQGEVLALLEEFEPVAPGADVVFRERFALLLERFQTGSSEVRAVIGARLEPLINARAPSQLLQAAAEGLAVGVVLWLVAMKPRRAGVIGAWFLMVYGVGRIATEFVRLPDTHFAEGAERLLGLSRGQWLSAAMVLVGAGLLAFVTRRASETYLGWRSGSSALASGAEASEAVGEPEAERDQAG